MSVLVFGAAELGLVAYLTECSTADLELIHVATVRAFHRTYEGRHDCTLFDRAAIVEASNGLDYRCVTAAAVQEACDVIGLLRYNAEPRPEEVELAAACDRVEAHGFRLLREATRYAAGPTLSVGDIRARKERFERESFER